MDAARHGRIKEVFLAVQALPSTERSAALERACASDVSLREEVESLLSHHQSASLLVAPAVPAPVTPARVAQIDVGEGASAKWDEEQRHLLHRRLRLWILALCLAAGFNLLRAFSVFGGPSGMPTGAVLIALLGGILSLLVVSIWLLRLRAPTYVQLRRFEVALSLSGAMVLFAWGHIWLANGATVTAQPAAQIDAMFRRSYWVASSDFTSYIQMPSAMIAGPLTSFWVVLGVFYSFVVPNTRRRGVAMIAANVLLLAAMQVSAAVVSPALRPILAQTLSFSTCLVVAFCSAALYTSLQFATLRRAVFEARLMGQYRLVRLLGSGAMGEVHLAQHHLLRRPCAIKLIRPDLAGSRDWLMRFEREVQAMAQLSHPNTVEVYDFGRTEDGSFFYAMEYLPGMTLDAVVRESGPMPPGRVVHLMLQVCGALAEAHDKGLVHRDIKPGNIFLSERGGQPDFIKLLDFGLVRSLVEEPALFTTPTPGRPLVRAREDANLTQAGQLLGTPTFMSPEQIRGKNLDGRSDIYSLGGVAYFLLTGRSLFERDTLADLFDAHLNAPVPRLRDSDPGAPADIEAVLMRCLAKDRESRFQSVRDVAEALRNIESAGTWNRSDAEAWWSEHPTSAEVEVSEARSPSISGVTHVRRGALQTVS